MEELRPARDLRSGRALDLAREPSGTNRVSRAARPGAPGVSTQKCMKTKAPTAMIRTQIVATTMGREPLRFLVTTPEIRSPPSDVTLAVGSLRVVFRDGLWVRMGTPQRGQASLP